MNHYHSHGHSHSHGHTEDLNNKNLLFATVLNLVITVAEIAGGLISNSLALLSDAIHNLGDTFAVLLAYIANRIGSRKANERKTFGYKRIEILTALLNAVILIVITVFLFIEAWERFQDPKPIKSLIMFGVATIGLLANLYAVILLKRDSKRNINIKAAYLHLLGDTISSVAVIIGSVLIYFFNIYWIDPLVTVLIGLYILKEAFSVVHESVNILMQAVPRSLNLNKIKISLESISAINNIHHVHVWMLADNKIHFECHADLNNDLKISETNKLYNQISKILENKFGISHVTIQFGFDCCAEKKLIKTEV